IPVAQLAPAAQLPRSGLERRLVLARQLPLGRQSVLGDQRHRLRPLVLSARLVRSVPERLNPRPVFLECLAVQPALSPLVIRFPRLIRLDLLALGYRSALLALSAPLALGRSNSLPLVRSALWLRLVPLVLAPSRQLQL